MKISTITLKDIKNYNLTELGYELFTDEDSTEEEVDLCEKKIDAIFKYGQFITLSVVIDENLNIVGGRVIPENPDWQKVSVDIEN